MDGVLVDLLNAKWNAFVKFRFYQKFFTFLLYFLVSLVCFTNRPGPSMPDTQKATSATKIDVSVTTPLTNVLPDSSSVSPNFYLNLTDSLIQVKGILGDVDTNVNNSTIILAKSLPNANIQEDENIESNVDLTYELISMRDIEELEGDTIWLIKNISVLRRKRNSVIKITIKRSSKNPIGHVEVIKNKSNIEQKVKRNIFRENKQETNAFNSSEELNAKSSDYSQNIMSKNILGENLTFPEKSTKDGSLPVTTEYTKTNYTHKNITNGLTEGVIYTERNDNLNIMHADDIDFEIFLQLETTNATENITFKELFNQIVQAAKKNSSVIDRKRENVNNLVSETSEEPVSSKETVSEPFAATTSVEANVDMTMAITEGPGLQNSSTKEKKNVKDDDDWWGIDETGECRLLKFNSLKSHVRLVAEAVMEVGALFYILEALREAHFLGLSMFIENLMTAPSRVMFLFSCFLMLNMPLLRFSCLDEAEDIMSVIIMLTTAPYFLFFCRGFKTVGPFVVMIYRMVMGDLLRFVSIYLMFVMGFSQAFYIIFLSYDNPKTPEGVDDSSSNPMPSPMESVMAMFLMSLTNFGDYYGAFEKTIHQFEAKLLFVVYMAIVAILLVNMLIAMMGNTYQKIAETRNEWQRQWARIVLVVERGVSPTERLYKLLAYSQPMADGRRALVLRLNQTEEDKEEMKEILEMKRVHDRIVKRRKRGAKPLGSPSGTATASAVPSPCPTKRLQGESTLLQPNAVNNQLVQQRNNQNQIQRY